MASKKTPTADRAEQRHEQRDLRYRAVIKSFMQELKELRRMRDEMRYSLESRAKNWRNYARTESENGHYGTAHNAQLQATELQFVIDEWLKR